MIRLRVEMHADRVFYGCLLFHEFHLEILLLRRRTTNWSKKWHKERDGKNGRERERKKSKIKIQDAFQVLVIVLNETTLYFI